MEDVLNQLLDDRELASPKRGRGREAGHFWATDMGKCHRQVYYSFVSPREIEGSKLRVFRVGSILHDYVQSLVKAQENRLFGEVRNESYVMVTDTESDLVITGRVDSLVYPKEPTGNAIALEFKTENEKSFSYRKSPPFQHMCQLMVYLRALRLQEGYIVYMRKSDLAVKAYKVQYDDQFFKSILKSTRQIYQHILKATLPDVKPDRGWECDYCLWKKECNANNNPALHSRLFPNRNPAEPAIQPSGDAVK